MPALRLMERILGKEPKFVFFDDNKAMISVVRSGKNLTMRHLERSHGVAVTRMHDMFARDYMYLAYEVTDRMAVDFHTKASVIPENGNMRVCKSDCWSRKCWPTRNFSRWSHLLLTPRRERADYASRPLVARTIIKGRPS